MCITVRYLSSADLFWFYLVIVKIPDVASVWKEEENESNEREKHERPITEN